MGRAKVLLGVGAVVIAAAIVYGFAAGGLFEEARILFGYPWFHVSMIDLYLGFFLVAGWIAYREKSVGRTLVWLVLLCTLGNLVSCLYALWALNQSRGDWRRFWLGWRAED